MQSATHSPNPFALMVDPKSVFDRIERSERLERLQRRVCRPLDKPLIPVDGAAAGDGADALGDVAESDLAAADAVERRLAEINAAEDTGPLADAADSI